MSLPYTLRLMPRGPFSWLSVLVLAVTAWLGTACGGGAGGTSSAAAARIDADSATPYLGIGVAQLSYWDGANAMADVMRESEFRGMDWTYDVGADANGDPTRDFQLIFSSRRFAAGTYTLVFTGQAAVSASGIAENGGVGPSIQNLHYDAASNTTTADLVVPNILTGNNWLAFGGTRRTAASTTSDGVTDVHLWRPGYATDGSAIFTREFIAAMQKFHFIRGMDLLSSNSNNAQHWADRPLMAHQGTASAQGQPWELLVQLANATGNDLWLNVPTQVDDDYITRLAQLLRYGSDGVNPYTSVQAHPVYPPLQPGQRVYLEYGNEVWNSGGGFYDFGWALALANAVMGDPTHPIAYDGALTDQYLALRRWIAYRSASISLIFRQVYGDAAMMTTVRPVLTGQAGNGNIYLSEGLKWAEGFYGTVRSSPANPVARQVSDLWWGGGGAAYYDSDTPPNDTSTATMSAYFAGLPNATFAQNIATDAVWMRGYGLKSVAYEGGPGPGGSALGGVSGTAALAATYNADPRMTDRMVAAHQIYQANGGQMLGYYVYSSSTPWSFVNDILPNVVADTSTPKLQAIDTIRTSPNAAPTLGTAVPGTIWLHDSSAGIQRNGGDDWRYNAQAFRFSADTTASGQAFSGEALVPLRTTQAGTFTFALTTYPEVDTRVELLINGRSAGFWMLAGTCGGICSGNPVTSGTLSAALPAGLSVVRIRPVSGQVWIQDLVVQQ